MRIASCALGGIGLFAAACVAPTQEWSPVLWLDYPSFVAEVEPILAERCANASCHGRPDRPLALYRAYGWRADPSRTYLFEPLTDEELRHNYEAACAYVTEAATPAKALLLQKPLGAAGGSYHGGDIVFQGTFDPDYRTVLRWVEAGWR